MTTPAGDAESPDPGQKAIAVWTLAVLFLANVVNLGDRMLLGMVAEPVRLELGLSDTQLSLAQGLLFVVANLTAGLVMARLVDYGNRKRILAAGITLWSLATAANGLVYDFTSLAVARVCVGIGEATLFPAAMSLIGDLFRSSSRGKAIAVYQSSGMLGMTAGTLLAGTLATALGWRWMFLVCGAGGIVLAVVVALAVPEPKRSVITDSPRNGAYLAELLATSRRVLQKPGLISLSIAFGLSAIPGAVLSGWGPTFLQRSHGWALDQIGLALASAIGFGGTIGTLTAGVLADRIVTQRGNPAQMLHIPMATLPIAVPLTLSFALTQNTAFAIASVFGLSLVLGCAVSPCINFAITQAPPRDRAVTSAIILAITGIIGGAFGPFLVGLTSDLLAAELGTESLRYAIGAIAGAPLIAAGFIWCAFHQCTKASAVPGTPSVLKGSPAARH